MKLLPLHRVGLGWAGVLGWEGIGAVVNWGLQHGLTVEQAARISSKLPWLGALGGTLAWTPPLLAGAGTLGLACAWQYWERRAWPAALAARRQPGLVLELRVPPTSPTLRTAFADTLEKIYTLLQAERGQVQRGEAVTVAWEIWSRPDGTRLYAWLPAQMPWPMVTALADLIRANYPGSRVLGVPDPFTSFLDPEGEMGPAVLVGVDTFKLQSDAVYPIRRGDDFQTDPLASLVAAVQADAQTPLVGLQIVTTAFNGSMQTDVRAALDRLHRQQALTKRAALPRTHKADILDLESKADAFGFDTLVRVVVVAPQSAGAGPALAARLDRVGRTGLGQYARATGSTQQGFVRERRQVIAVPAGTMTGRLDGVAVVRDRHPRPLSPLGRRLDVLNAGELATIFHPPATTLARQAGLACWQRAQIFPAPAGVWVPDGPAAADWLITGRVPQDLQPPGTPPRYLGVRRAALNQHIYGVGPTRSGKTKLLENLTRQDLDGGWGVGVIDPKGGPNAESDYARKTVLMVPGEREGQVCWFDPVDPARRIMTVNPLERRPGVTPALLQSGMIGITGKLGASWEVAPLGKRFMQHAIALLVTTDPLPDSMKLYKLLQNPKEGNPDRDRLLAAANPELVEQYAVMATDFWTNQVPGMKETQLGSMQTALTRLETFLSNETILHIVAQAHSTINLGALMDSRGIFIASITPALGDDMQAFLGTLVLTLITQAGFARGQQPGDHPFWRLTVDEFQKFIAVSGSEESFEDVLSMLGGLGVGMTLAHQTFDQIPDTLLGVILGNVGTRFFYPSQKDAPAIARQLPGQARPEDLLYLERFWTTQVLPTVTGNSGAVTAAPLGIAARAADLPERAVPEAVRRHPAVVRWGQPVVARDSLDTGRLRDLAGAKPGETPAQQQARIKTLVREFYGPACERDSRIVPVLCALSTEDYALYQRIRRATDADWRAQILAYPAVLGPVNGEAAKLRRVALLSDLGYGLPQIEARAQVRRAMGTGSQPSIERLLGLDTTRSGARPAPASPSAGQGDAAQLLGLPAPRVPPPADGSPLADTPVSARNGVDHPEDGGVAVGLSQDSAHPAGMPADTSEAGAGVLVGPSALDLL